MAQTTGNDVVIFRSELSDVLADLKAGKLTPPVANAYANVCGKLLQSVKLELEFNKAVGSTPSIGFLSRKHNDQLKALEKPQEKLTQAK